MLALLFNPSCCLFGRFSITTALSMALSRCPCPSSSVRPNDSLLGPLSLRRLRPACLRPPKRQAHHMHSSMAQAIVPRNVWPAGLWRAGVARCSNGRRRPTVCGFHEGSAHGRLAAAGGPRDVGWGGGGPPFLHWNPALRVFPATWATMKRGACGCAPAGRSPAHLAAVCRRFACRPSAGGGRPRRGSPIGISHSRRPDAWPLAHWCHPWWPVVAAILSAKGARLGANADAALRIQRVPSPKVLAREHRDRDRRPQIWRKWLRDAWACASTGAQVSK